MEIIRRNTDYALRAMIHLGRMSNEGPVSTRDLAKKEDISYQLACKLMQRLSKEELVRSRLGPTGGFELGKEVSKINLLEIIETIQGPLVLNRCTTNERRCKRLPECPVNTRLCELQEYIEKYLGDVTLADLVDDPG